MSKQNNTKTNAKSSATKTKRGVVSPSNHATMRATPSKTPTTASKRRKIEELELTVRYLLCHRNVVFISLSHSHF